MITQADALQPWDKRAVENPRAFQLFTMYRDMGAARTLRKVARDAGVSLSLVSNWSQVHDWVDRAAAWDIMEDRERQIQQVEDLRAMQRRHVAVASSMMSKAIEKIRTIDANTLTVREAVLLADLGARMERAARGMADQTLELRGALELTGPSGSAILKALRDVPSLLEFADAIDEALENGSTQLPAVPDA